MSRSLNHVTLLGHIGQDPEVRETANGTRVATVSLATSRAWTDASGNRQEQTEWHRCVAWNRDRQKLADVIESYVRKGDRLHVTGEIQYRQWQDKEGQTRYTTEINVRDVILLGSKGDGNERGSQSDRPSSQGADRSQREPDTKPMSKTAPGRSSREAAASYRPSDG